MAPEIVNPGLSDLHTHCIEYSDGIATIEAMIEAAGGLGLQELAITDHSYASRTSETIIKLHGRPMGSAVFRKPIPRWGNWLNDVVVSFGVEGDILNSDGDVCFEVYEGEPEDGTKILSAHTYCFRDDPSTINDAYARAIERHSKEISFLGHPDIDYFAEHLDMMALIKLANEHGISMEFNCKNFCQERSVQENLELMLKFADRITISTDAHSTSDLVMYNIAGRQFLQDRGFNVEVPKHPLR